MCLSLLLRSRCAPLFLRDDGVRIHPGSRGAPRQLSRRGECDMAIDVRSRVVEQPVGFGGTHRVVRSGMVKAVELLFLLLRWMGMIMMDLRCGWARCGADGNVSSEWCLSDGNAWKKVECLEFGSTKGIPGDLLFLLLIFVLLMSRDEGSSPRRFKNQCPSIQHQISSRHMLL
ncbi:uncharacterized protein EAF01_003025 [Botrytis porri]|uniref:uncharacterized protein n=1 Tax=Botrytis porri TaxID=87229 RepID=UPI001900F12A|nr:uncharacterized protein EAF01_003025 [Botrytis porri]KAF7909307.1 hypothetical protein EAF01_003025 [Botrytis porri]